MLVESVSSLLLRWRGGHAFTGRLFGNREELRLLMQESAKALTSEEAVMINRVLDFQTATVRQVMKPLDKAVTVTVRTSIGETLSLCREHKHTRLPVWGERDGRQRIIGLLSCNRLLFQPELDPAKLAGEHVMPALYLDEDLRLEVVLQRMQRSGQRLAIVVGRDRVEKGIISLQDVLKVIFGEVSF
jgi:CBS domain containing-hemolysin-like protein